MTELEFRTAPRVTLIRWMGGDLETAQHARVSTGADSQKGYAGLVKRLAHDRHGSPFEHSVFTFEIETSIMVARESHRHRMASISEASLRYMEGLPVVYVPGPDRHLIPEPGTKQMEYATMPGDEIRDLVDAAYVICCEGTWAAYQQMLTAGALREVARGVLPLCFGTKWHLTLNSRALMNYLSLRIEDEDADRVSHPQREIEQVAELMETIFAEKMPVTYQAFIDNGRRVP